MRKEKWISILAYKGFYECSTEGRIRNSFGRIMKLFTKENGYTQIILSKYAIEKCHFLHRIIYESFKGKTKLQIDHINDIKSDCRLINLQALSANDNNIKAKARKFKTSKFPGVHKLYNGKFKAQIGKNGLKFCLGTFEKEKEAHQAYLNAR